MQPAREAPRREAAANRAEREPSLDARAPQATDGPARQALIAAFADMPFEKAVRALGAFDEATRAAILEKLGLHHSVRRRIEQELAELSHS